MQNTVYSVRREVSGYIVKNIFASLGISLYVLVDTLFIALAAGSIGLATLNIVLPIFNLFNSLGLLLGVGGAAIFSLNKVRHPERIEGLYSELIIFCVGLGILFAIIGNLFHHQILTLMGANQQTINMATTYFRIVSCGAPLFMANYVTINFVRNDGNPSLTMRAALTQTAFVIFMDWLLIFGLNLKMEGAALATIFSPLTSLTVLSRHRHFAQRQLKLFKTKVHLKTVLKAARLGIPSFLNEMSTGVSIFVFNLVLLKLGGNYAIAAYGVIANIGIVFLAIFNGVALGVQPIASREYGKHLYQNVKIALKIGLLVTFSIAIISYFLLLIFKAPIVDIFNAEHEAQLVAYAVKGIPIYFISIFFSCLNLVLMLFLAAINDARGAFFLSILRGYIILLPSIIIFAYFGGIAGVWASVPFTEFIVASLGIYLTNRKISTMQIRKESLL